MRHTGCARNAPLRPPNPASAQETIALHNRFATSICSMVFRLRYDIEPSRKTYVPRTWDRQTDGRIANVHSITLLISMGLQQVLDDTRSLSYLLYHQKGRLTRPSRYGDELHSLAGICKKTLVRTVHNVTNERRHGMFSFQGTHSLGFSNSLQAVFTVYVRGI